MGIFSSKKKTTTEKFSDTTVSHKLIKLTYLQTLSVTSNLASISELAGETAGSTTEFDDDKVKSNKNLLTTIGRIIEGRIKDPIIDKIYGGIVNKLFGKSVSTSVSGTVTDSGWHVVKSFLEPAFDKIRYAIGIRELTVARFTYEQTSEVVSKVWISPKEISKIYLIVDEFIPPQFDPGPAWIEYYVKPELENQDWVRINPMGGKSVFKDNGELVPRIININGEKPVNTRLEDAYITTKEPVKAVRFKAILRRPDSIVDSDIEASAYTPILKSYRMMFAMRGGL